MEQYCDSDKAFTFRPFFSDITVWVFSKSLEFSDLQLAK